MVCLETLCVVKEGKNDALATVCALAASASVCLHEEAEERYLRTLRNERYVALKQTYAKS